MIGRFGGGYQGTVFEQLATLRQEEIVEDYVREFEILVEEARGVLDEQMLGYFLAGLREDIKGQVRIHDRQELMVAMRIAGDVKDGTRRARGGSWNGFKSSQSGPRAMGVVSRNEISRPSMSRPGGMRSVGSVRKEGITTNGRGSDNRGRLVRNLPYPEFLKRKEEGRCFRCGGPFAPGHHCPEKSLRVVLLAEDEKEEDNVEVADADQKPMELSACSTEGITQPKTMKLVGRIGDKRVLVLIDSGASQNFISRALAEELKLPITDTPPIK